MADVHRHRGKRFHHREQALGIGYERYDVVLPQQPAQPQLANEPLPATATPPQIFSSSDSGIKKRQDPFATKAGVMGFVVLLLGVLALLRLLSPWIFSSPKLDSPETYRGRLESSSAEGDRH